MKFIHKFSLVSSLFSFVFLFNCSIACSIAMDGKIEGRLSFSKPGRDVMVHCRKNLNTYDPLTFDTFNGSNVVFKPIGQIDHYTAIEVQEDGLYSLGCHYFWQIEGSERRDGPFTGIAIDNANNFGVFYKRQIALNGNWDEGYISRVTKLKKGNQVMVSVRGVENSFYNLHYWGLYIEKLSN